MLSFTLFVVSGVAIATLTISKRIEEKTKKTPFVLRAVSRGDERVRGLHHEALRQYSHSKDKFGFYLKKQLPLKLKSLFNRFQAYVKERGAEYLGDVRDSRLLKKSDGISEFFKNISEVEKGGGEINETYTEPVIEAVAKEIVITTTTETTELKKPSTPAPRKRVPRKKVVKLVVTEEV